MATTNPLDNLLSDAVSLFTEATSVLAPVYTALTSDLNSIISVAQTASPATTRATPTPTSTRSSSTFATSTSSTSTTTSSTSSRTSATAAAAATTSAAAVASNDDGGSNKLAIILGSVLGVLLLLALLGILWFCLRRRRRREQAGSQLDTASTSASVEAWRASTANAQPAYPLLHDDPATRTGHRVTPAPMIGPAPPMVERKGADVSHHPIFVGQKTGSPPRHPHDLSEDYNTWTPTNGHSGHANPFTPVPPPPRRGSDSPLRNHSPLRGRDETSFRPVATRTPTTHASVNNQSYFTHSPPSTSTGIRDGSTSPNRNDVFIPGTVPLVPGAGGRNGSISDQTHIEHPNLSSTGTGTGTYAGSYAAPGVGVQSDPYSGAGGLSGMGRRRSSASISAAAAAAGLAAAGLQDEPRDEHSRTDEAGRRFSIPRKPIPAPLATSTSSPQLVRDGSDDTLIVERPYPLRRDSTPPEVPSRSPRRTRFSDVEYDDGTRKSLTDLRAEIEAEEEEERRRGRGMAVGSRSEKWAFGRAD